MLSLRELALRIIQEQDEDEEEHIQQGLMLAYALMRVEHARQLHNLRRLQTCRYLIRAELLDNPRTSTPWRCLWDSQSDRAFITTMGFDVATFHFILEGPGRFAELWDARPIPRSDVCHHGRPRLSRHSLDATGALGLILHYLCSAMSETSLQQIFALISTTVKRYIRHGQKILLRVIRRLPEAAIHLPITEDECDELTSIVYQRHNELWGAIGTIDGLDLPVLTSSDPELKNATYNGWKAMHCIKNIFAFSAHGKIIIAILNAPGSWHDARTALPIYMKLLELPDGFYLVADMAFPRGADSIKGKIRTAMKAGEHLPDDPAERETVLHIDRQLISFRQTAEWGMHILQGSHPRLRLPLPISDPVKRQELLETCVRLTNIRTERVGINEIKRVYERIWKEAEDERLWNDLGAMLFSDIRKLDRVARFHLM
ncbi:hypothetical protein FISHEDRAFT_79106 [Fistulina hepatica ATCC 64428]|uniref:DDE Tnp4 domain-containing protein n=1 Tax=Fistulina hepatica ATCC 64428 TaxID=1128425 RepID=A0A0D6ZZ88_9AGAR|nr:hypothetical protein FISHEDRAFT_79106 [Fistulina hepatica ATCC 64428]